MTLCAAPRNCSFTRTPSVSIVLRRRRRPAAVLSGYSSDSVASAPATSGASVRVSSTCVCAWEGEGGRSGWVAVVVVVGGDGRLIRIGCSYLTVIAIRPA